MNFTDFYINIDKILSSAEFEDNGGIFINQIKWDNRNAEIEVEIDSGSTLKHYWKITANKTVKESIERTQEYDLSVLDEHPLLWEYNDNKVELFFSKKAKFPFNLVNDVFETHNTVTGEWINLNEYINFNSNFSLINLCSSSNALFAEGPKKLILNYYEVLKKHNMNPKFLKEYPPKIFYKNQWVSSLKLKILIIGNSFVIAENFEFKKLIMH